MRESLRENTKGDASEAHHSSFRLVVRDPSDDLKTRFVPKRVLPLEIDDRKVHRGPFPC